MGRRGGRGRRLARRGAACVDELGVAPSAIAAIDWRSPEALTCVAKWRESKCTVRLVTGPSRSPQKLFASDGGGRGSLKRRDGLAHGGDGAPEISAPHAKAEQSQQLAGLLSPSSALGRRCETREGSAEGSGGALSTAPTVEVASEEQELGCGSETGPLRQRGSAGRVQDAAARGARAAAAVQLAEAEGRAAVATESAESILALAAEKDDLLRSALCRAAAAEAAAAEQRRVAAAAQAEMQQMRLRLQCLGAERAAALRRADELRDALHDAAAARHAAQRRHADSERRAELAGRAAAQLQLRLGGLGEQHAEALRKLEALRAAVRSLSLEVNAAECTGLRSLHGAVPRRVLATHLLAAERAAVRVPSEEDPARWEITTLVGRELRVVTDGSGSALLGSRAGACAQRPPWADRHLTPRLLTTAEVLRVDAIAHCVAEYCPGYWAPACSTFAESACTVTRMWAEWLSELTTCFYEMQHPGSDICAVSPAVEALREFKNLKKSVTLHIRDLPVLQREPGARLLRRLDMVIVIFEECRVRMADWVWDISPELKKSKRFTSGVTMVLNARDARREQ